MTPAVKVAKKNRIDFKIHEYEHDPSSGSYGQEAAAKMGQNPERVFKTLMVRLGENVLAVAVLPVDKKLDLKAMASVCDVKKVAMAEKKEAQRITGYTLGGISPLGQKKKLKTIIDHSANHFETVFVSAGRRGLEIELSADSLARLTGAEFCRITI